MRNFKLSRRELLLFCTPVPLLAAALLYRVWNNGDKLEKAQHELAGKQAIDCGVGHSETAENNLVSQDRTRVDACAVAAFKAKKPFLARYDNTVDGGHSPLGNDAMGIVGTPQGQIHFFYYAYSTGWWKKQLQFRQAVCPEPKIIFKLGRRSPNWQALGCGTCAGMASEDTANCILHPSGWESSPSQ